MAPKNPKSEINDWCIFATQGTQKATYFTESDDAKPPSYRCTLRLPDGRTFQSKEAHKKKKDAEQDAAETAMLTIGRSEPEPSIAEPSSDTAAGRWQLVKHRLEAAFSDKNVVHFSPLYPFFVESKLTNRPIPLTAIAQLDSRLAAALRGVDPRAEWDPLCGLTLLVAAVRECEGMQLSSDGLAVVRTQPWPEGLNRPEPPGWEPREQPPGSHNRFAAVFLPQDINRAPAGFKLSKVNQPMSEIAEALGVSGDPALGSGCRTHRVLVSRPVAKAGSNLRIYSEHPPVPTAHVSRDGSVIIVVPAASTQRNHLPEADSQNHSENANPWEDEGERFQDHRTRGAESTSGEVERNVTAGTEPAERNGPVERSVTGFSHTIAAQKWEAGEEVFHQHNNVTSADGLPSGFIGGTSGTGASGRAERNAEPEQRNGRNERASWVAGYAVYGDAVVSSTGTTYSSQGKMTWDDFSTQEWHTLLSSRHPRGMYQLNRGAPLATTLPRLYSGSDRWEGKTPKTLLYELVKHKCSGAEGKEPIYTVSEKGATAGGSTDTKSPSKKRCSLESLGDEEVSREAIGDGEPGEVAGKRPKLELAVGSDPACSLGGDPLAEPKWEAEVRFLFDHQWREASAQRVWTSPREAENCAALVALHAVQALFDARVLTREAAKEEASLGGTTETEHEGTAIVDYTMLYALDSKEQEEVVEFNRRVLQPLDVGAVGWAEASNSNREASSTGKDGKATPGGESQENRGASLTGQYGEATPGGGCIHNRGGLGSTETGIVSGETEIDTNRGLQIFPESGPTAVGLVLEDNRGFLVARGTGALLPQLEACIDTCPQGETRTVRLRPLSSWRPVLGTAWEDSLEPNCVDHEDIEEAQRKEGTTFHDVIVHLRVCGYVEPREQRLEGALFTPSLAAQRMDFALGVIDRRKAASVLDLGCGSGAFLETVVGKATCVTRLAGVDISERALQKARKVVRAKFDKRASENALRERGKLASADDVQILSGSMLTLDERFVGWDLATCIEVVEHLDPGPLAEFGPAVLGRLRPRSLLVSTPNIEYNTILQAAAIKKCASRDEIEVGGVSAARLRNDDHRFEWTRAEFEAWANGLAATYGYSVEFSGVGSNGTGLEPGFCTQIALFRQEEA